MHKRRGRPRAVAAVRASTGLTTHRPTGARVRAWCHSSQDPTAGRDREPVCEPHDSTGEPGAGDRPAGFGERGEETYPWVSACGPGRKRRKCHRPPTGHAPPLDSTILTALGGTPEALSDRVRGILKSVEEQLATSDDSEQDESEERSDGADGGRAPGS